MGALLGTAALTGGSMILQNVLNKRAQDRAFEQNRQFWQERFDTEAKYNSPVEQKARMQAAGLNPALMYKSGAGGGGNVTSPSAQGKIAERYELGQLALQSAQVAKIVEDTNKAKAEKLYIESKTEGQGSTNKILLQNAFMKAIEAGRYDQANKAAVEKLVQDALKAKSQAKSAEQEQQILENVYLEASKEGIDLRKGQLQVLFQALWSIKDAPFDFMESLYNKGAETVKGVINNF